MMLKKLSYCVMFSRLDIIRVIITKDFLKYIVLNILLESVKLKSCQDLL